MSQNNHLDAAWQYHSGTKHSPLSIRMNPHFLDWDNKPLLFKIYPTLEVMRLPRDFRETGRAALDGGPLQNARIVEQITALLIGMNIRYKGHAGVRITGLPPTAYR